eukprot:gene39088-51441_t
MSTPDVTDIMNVLGDQLEANQDPFDDQAISNALYGLQGMKCDCRQVERILSLLLHKISQHKHKLQQDIHSTSHHPSPYVSPMPLQGLLMRPQGLGMAALGLRSMSSTHPEVSQLQEALAGCLDRMSQPLDAQGFANIMEGLKGSCSESRGTRTLLTALRHSLDKEPTAMEGLTPKELAMALHGLQGLSSDCSETTDLLDSINRVLEHSLSSLPPLLLSSGTQTYAKTGDDVIVAAPISV